MAIQPLCSGSRSQRFFNEHQITPKYIELCGATTFCVCNCYLVWEWCSYTSAEVLSDPPTRSNMPCNGTEYPTCTITTNYKWEHFRMHVFLYNDKTWRISLYLWLQRIELMYIEIIFIIHINTMNLRETLSICFSIRLSTLELIWMNKSVYS